MLRPAAVTLVSSYYSIALPAGDKVPQPNAVVIVLDVITSFLVVPFFVVWFWRGSWLVLDYYFWEFSPEASDVWKSIGYSTLMALILMVATSETAFSFIMIDNQVILGLVGRLRTYVLAWGVVNYWRAVWYIWDESAGTSVWSCWVCHFLPLGILTAIGCMSCILAPASTIGVDFVPHPDCADEPLFSNLPVPADDLYIFAIARDPQMLDEQELPNVALETKKSFIRMSLITDQVDVDDVIAANTKKNAEKSVEMGKLPTTTHPSAASLTNSGHTGATDATAAPSDDAAEKDEIIPPTLEEDGSPPPDGDHADEEAEMAVAWAAMEQKMDKAELASASMNASTAWASGGTGRRGSYSSVRTKAEVSQRRSSYFDVQRPDLDRRVSHRASVRASQRVSVRGSVRGSTSGGGAVRRTSDLFRNR